MGDCRTGRMMGEMKEFVCAFVLRQCVWLNASTLMQSLREKVFKVLIGGFQYPAPCTSLYCNCAPNNKEADKYDLQHCLGGLVTLMWFWVPLFCVFAKPFGPQMLTLSVLLELWLGYGR